MGCRVRGARSGQGVGRAAGRCVRGVGERTHLRARACTHRAVARQAVCGLSRGPPRCASPGERTHSLTHACAHLHAYPHARTQARACTSARAQTPPQTPTHTAFSRPHTHVRTHACARLCRHTRAHARAYLHARRGTRAHGGTRMHVHVHAGEVLPWDGAEVVAREPGFRGTEGTRRGWRGDMQGMEGETQGTATKDGWLIPAICPPATEPERGH